jgi:23S rRNA pseudouridine955/2504/2580 synthase
MSKQPTTQKPSQRKAGKLSVSSHQAGQRIDNFLLKHFKGVPKSHIYRLLRSGQVRVNSGRIKPDYRIQEGDNIRIPPLRYNDSDDATVPETVLKKLKDAIIYEDEGLICINKPAGIAVHKGSGLRFGVIEAFRQLRPDQPIELVHRLDRDTSGCLLLAKDRDTLNRCHELLRHETISHIRKTYIALLHGHWDESIRTIDIGISKVKRSGEHIMQSDETGDRAVSHFELLEQFDGELPCCLVQVVIETGRTHQIRVHSRHAGHPIIGDSRYGDKAANKAHREQGLKRLMLHAKSLYLPPLNSTSDTPISIEAPLETEFASYIEQLRDHSKQK